MDIKELLKNELVKCLKALGVEATPNDIVIENSKDPSHGDYATNVAMKYCKVLHNAPVKVAEQIVGLIHLDELSKIEIAGPGFINFFVKANSLQAIVAKINNEGENYGRSSKKNVKVNVEFVSANPTGELHVGHARGAAIGDSLCRILDFAGYDVTREYYINDAGNQINNLGLSLEARYKELQGLPFELPEDGYHGQDIVEIAKKILNQYGKKEFDLDFFKTVGKQLELERIKEVLNSFGVKFDVFSSELDIRSNNAVDKELEFLKDHIYNDGDAKVLRTTDYLDDKDRVIVKSNGDYTYFLPDIVYHVNKMSRGFDKLIDVLGADHHGYINRMKSALMMHGYSADTLDIELIQMVRFMKDGVEIKASKRSGNALTMQDLYDEIGPDATRYFFAMRAASSHLDFDLNLALEQSSNNPVYYAQYAHARLCSILSQGADIGIDLTGTNLTAASEVELLKFLAKFNDVVNDAAENRAPYRIANYIHELAELIHGFYTECRVIDRENLSLSASRLGLCKACKIVMKNALNLVGVSAPEHM